MDRKQMTFFISFWEAIDSLPKKDQLPMLRAVVSYGLFGEHEEKLSPAQSAFFSLMQPVLDSSRKKAASGKQGGKQNGKQTESKPQANRKQTEREKENEKEDEKEIEDECPRAREGFEQFWEQYPNKTGMEAAKTAWEALDAADTREIFDGLGRWLRSVEWGKENGRFIPRPARWLAEKRWKESPVEILPKGASGGLGEAEMCAIRRMLGETDKEESHG